jgi:putative membrane protein
MSTRQSRPYFLVFVLHPASGEKEEETMRGAYIWSVALAAALTLACDRSDRSETTTAGGTGADSTVPGRAGDRDPGPAAPMARANDTAEAHSFVEKMARVNAAEVQLGELAAQRGTNPEVKQFGRRMAAEHQKANAELKQVAAKMNVTPPAEPDDTHRDLHERLSKLKGAEFDREFMNAMVEGHEEAVRDLQRQADASARGGDRTVGTTGQAGQADPAAPAKQWAAKTLPDVQKHLEQARQIQGKLKQ